MGTGSNNTNKLSPQEPMRLFIQKPPSSNNTNKLSPQEPKHLCSVWASGSNNTNKLSPQEHLKHFYANNIVQIIQINLVLKNHRNVIKSTHLFK